MVSAVLIAAVCTLLVSMMALVGCAGDGANSKSTLTPEIVSEIGAYKATANNAGEKSAVMSGNAVEAKEGQIIVISANLEEGSFSVELSSESLKQPITKEVSGQTIEICEVDPGKYGVGVTCASEEQPVRF